MELPPRLSVGTICIALLCEGLILPMHLLEFRHRNGKMLGTQTYPTYRSAYTHFVPNPNLIKGLLIGYLRLTHTLTCI